MTAEWRGLIRRTPMTTQPTADSSTFEALWPSDLFTVGIGWVILARFKPDGRRVEAAVFLVDVFCLGVKLAVFEAGAPADYQQRIRNHYVNKFPMVPAEPCCAGKLLIRAVEYAGKAGFDPHPDYAKAMRPFGGVSSSSSVSWVILQMHLPPSLPRCAPPAVR